MATLDNYSPYGTGMSAKQAVEALWNGYNLPNNYCMIISKDTPPNFNDVKTDCTYWYNTANCKLYRAHKNDEESIVVWFEV